MMVALVIFDIIVINALSSKFFHCASSDIEKKTHKTLSISDKAFYDLSPLNQSDFFFSQIP